MPPEADREWPTARQVMAMIGELLDAPGLGEGDKAGLRDLVTKYGRQDPDSVR